ncbi:MAG: ECF-type sigma factor [Planctomycetota bacterium]
MPPEEVTLCLRQMRDGDGSAVHRLLPHVYADLRAVARQVFGTRRGMTMQPTVLVHEAFLRMVKLDDPQWNDRQHFLRVAALAMRQLLTDYARSKSSERHGGAHERVALQHDESSGEAEDFGEVDLLDLREALEKLRALNPRQAEIVELRFFAGLTVKEAASVLGAAERTVYLDWKMARGWFQRELGSAGGE